jgi:DNA topoisomerase I
MEDIDSGAPVPVHGVTGAPLDDDLDDIPLVRQLAGSKRPRGAPAAAKKSAAPPPSDDDDDDEDDDDDDDSEPETKGSAKKRKPAAKKTPSRAAPKGKKSPAKRSPATKPAAKKPTAKKAAVAGVKAPSASAKKVPVKAEDDDDKEVVSKAPAKRAKELKPLEAVEKAMKAYKWWEVRLFALVACAGVFLFHRSSSLGFMQSQPLPDGIKWRTMEHNGVIFPPPYKPHGVRMLYNGAPVDLTPEQEEVATFYAGVC